MASGDFPKGQDLGPKEQFTSTTALEFQNQANVKQLTASDIVGVQHHQEQSKQPISLTTQNAYWGIDSDENTKLADELFKKKPEEVTEKKEETNSSLNFYGVEKKEYGKIFLNLVAQGDPIPGYLGYVSRVNPANIFGQTFAASLQSSKEDKARIEQARVKNYLNTLDSLPKVKK